MIDTKEKIVKELDELLADSFLYMLIGEKKVSKKVKEEIARGIDVLSEAYLKAVKE